MSFSETNPCGLTGIDFVEFAGPDPDKLHELFLAFGFSQVQKHRDANVIHYLQGGIHFLLNRAEGTQAEKFAQLHGPCVSAMGWKTTDPARALETAVARGAKPYYDDSPYDVPAVYGIGDSLIYFVLDTPTFYETHFEDLDEPSQVPDLGFQFIDHLTNNVENGEMDRWSTFYKTIFGFTEVRYFDIRGMKTGLTSYALRSPDGSFCIPINEGTEEKSQINEYLREYKGPGIQHIALASQDLLASLDGLDRSKVETLDIDDEYYDTVFDRVPNVSEDHGRIQAHNVLVDGDEEGYLLQIFTRNIIGPIFIELIQRKNHHSFGEGNFGALFRAIERDQERRGVL